MTNEYIIDVKNLNKQFNGKYAVKDLALNVRSGEIFGFLGPNGSGKTTTIRMLCGLITPDSGEGQCLGYDILKESNMIRRLVGYVPQSFSLYQDLTVEENLKFIARVYEMPDVKKAVAKIISDLGLTPYKKQLAGRLSGGWKQRLSLAAGLIHEPKLLLLDEPTAGVDPAARREFWNDISHLTTKGISSLVSTHYMDEAERCHRLAYIVYGELMIEGTIDEIKQQVKLTTLITSGDHLVQLQDKMMSVSGVDQVVILGNELRICGHDEEALIAASAKFPDYVWRKVPSSLEEVFIYLVEKRKIR